MTTLPSPDVVAARRATRDRLGGLLAGGLTGDALVSKIGIPPRQMEVLRLTAQGMSNAAIAEKMFVSEDTVKTHKRRLALALGALNSTHAVAIAYKLGILRAFVSRCPSCGWAPGQRTNGGAA